MQIQLLAATRSARPALLALLCSGLLAACGGGGGGSGEPAAAAGDAQVSVPLPPPPRPPVPYAEAEQLFAFITAVEVPSDGQPVVDFQLSDGQNTAITDLGPGDIRFTIAKLQLSEFGHQRGAWQSYVNRIEEPGVGPGEQARLQATAERGTSGSLSNNGDGTYRYRFAQSISSVDDPEIAAQAAAEGLDLAYDPSLTHRVAMQFGNARQALNPVYDWVPDGSGEGLFNLDIVATANCNGCHEQLALHGGGRIETQYCVTCHNPGSSDANSGNTVDFKVMVHKIHRGAALPSVAAGGEYAIWGFNESKHDYSGVHLPRDIRDCQVCHGGKASADADTLQATSQGDNWLIYPGQAACGSCHDDLDFALHYGGQADDSNCASCHQLGAVAGSIQERHRNLVAEAGQRFEAEILAISNTAPGEFPEIQYRVVDPSAGGAPYDLQNDPAWTQGGGASRLAIDIAWSSSDYSNTGNGADTASAVSLNALAGTPLGDGSYLIESDVAIPDGSAAPGIAASGSGAVAIEGHPAIDIGSAATPDVQRIAFPSVVEYFSIDEPGGQAQARREVVAIDKCLACHGQLSLHGRNRTDNIELCVTCHNPRNTDREVREIAASPPSDGKDEETIDFKVMVHAIHGAAMRAEPLQIVGFGGFSTHVYDGATVHYPGRLDNCASCHVGDSYALPLDEAVLATTVDTGSDHVSPLDDAVVSPTTAVCSACHDGAAARAHMGQSGGSFATTQAALDDGRVYEQCTACHGPGGIADVGAVHRVSGY